MSYFKINYDYFMYGIILAWFIFYINLKNPTVYYFKKNKN